MKRPLVLSSLAVAGIALGAWLISITWKISYGHALYCSVGLASTDGCDASPSSAIARTVAVVVILTVIPILAAVFALLQNLHLHKKISKSMDDKLDKHHNKIMKSLGKDSDVI